MRSEWLVVDILPGEDSPDSDGAVRETFRFEWTLPLIGGGGRLAGPLEAILGKHFATTEGAKSCSPGREEETVLVELRTSRGEVAHIAGIGSHSTSSCSGRGCDVVPKLDGLFSKWFPMSRDVLSFEATDDDGVATSSARVSHQDSITRESLKRFLALSSPQGTDHGVSSLLRAKLALALEETKDFQVVRNRSRRGRGRKARDASARYVGLEISISVTESGCGGPGKARSVGRAKIRTQLQWVSTSPPFVGNGTRGPTLVDGVKDWIARHLEGPCRFCERSALLVSAGADARGFVEFDLKGDQGLGPAGAWKPEEFRASHEGGALWQETRVTKSIKGHHSSLYFTEVYGIHQRQSGMLSLCLESYVMPHATPLFSASTVTVRSLSGDGGETKSWPLLALRGTRATYLPSTTATSSSASLLSLCLDLDLDLDKDLDKDANMSGEEAAWAVTLYLEYRKSFPQVFGLRADRSAGLYLPSTLVYPSECKACGHFLAPTRVMYPLPDASMPYNASIITCTIFALCMGLTLKTLGFVIKPTANGDGPASRRKKLVRKAIKVGVNVMVLGILAGVVIMADSEVGFHLKNLLYI